jgi:hypothetical protein
MQSRGIVVIPDWKPSGNTIESVQTSPQKDIDTIKRHLTYWDKIDLASNPIINTSIPYDAIFLAQQGVLSQTDIPLRALPGRTWEEKFTNNYIEVFRLHDTAEPGQWVMGQSGPVWSLPITAEQPGRRVLVELYNVLPGPGRSVSLEDVYDFKTKRSSELTSLRIHLDSMYHEISQSDDIDHALSMSKTRLEQSLNDLNRVANESWVDRIRQSVVVELSPGAMAASATSGAIAMAAETPYTIPLVIGALVGIVGSALKITITERTFFAKLPERLNAFAYLYKPESP